ncbi:tRNA lysidine(34) synthetase TilS [Aliiroseovarius sp. M344]|uniref:tRNA lysidine(34) synthetase TilS n=1 Tax=Aliiroseovarius sp. M344 TaxID=2867010 RepID=UPI0021ADA635|nr:tRNA lysidine(34) synthetase TilS [Aliiroseovarius sp. M344]UWQ13397.1 tRNA lysidine(34) synthetase TilS [Aliiroseovarius sp. M344]
MTPDADLADALHRVRAGGPVLRLGVAVSGGGDSMALLRLAKNWCSAHGAALFAATVDHRLRPDAADEAQLVHDTCASLSVQHETLVWQNSPEGNLQDAARRARYDLLAEWAKRLKLDAVLLGHTADDQAETFVMRLARGSGVDGLATMRSDWRDRGVQWMRPLLATDRATLRNVLVKLGQHWVEDPSNDDTQFDRVRVRQAMQQLSHIGLDRARLTETADRMAGARDALSWLAHDSARRIAQVQGGDVHFAREDFGKLPTETRHRLLAHAINYVSSTPYRPRYTALCALENDVLSGKTRTLQGCLISRTSDGLVIGRELNAVASTQSHPGALWDGRWVLQAPDAAKVQDLLVKPLGDGITQCENWRDAGLTRTTLMAGPALWHQDQVIAAPLAGFGEMKLLLRLPDTEEFLSTILSH